MLFACPNTTPERVLLPTVSGKYSLLLSFAVMLVLFDVDGTMLSSHGAGIRAMQRAGRDMYGEHFSTKGVSFAGRIDPHIWRDMAEKNDVADPDADLSRFIEMYHRELMRGFAADDRSLPLPGVKELVARLSETENITLGILTGNFEPTGRLKLEKAGFDLSLFKILVWGVDGETRSHLPLVALEQYRELTGQNLPPEHAIIIGDTPHDVTCALDNGCRVLCVATGHYSVQELQQAGAHLALPDLSDVDAVLQWLVSGRDDLVSVNTR